MSDSASRERAPERQQRRTDTVPNRSRRDSAVSFWHTKLAVLLALVFGALLGILVVLWAQGYILPAEEEPDIEMELRFVSQAGSELSGAVGSSHEVLWRAEVLFRNVGEERQELRFLSPGCFAVISFCQPPPTEVGGMSSKDCPTSAVHAKEAGV